MRKQWKVLVRKGAIGAFIFALSLLPLRKILLSLKFGNSDFDFLYVLFTLILPSLLRAIALGVLASAVLFAIKMLTLPRSMIEKELYRLKKRKLLKNLFYSVIIILPLLFPVKSGTQIIQIVSRISGSLPAYFFPLYAPLYLVGYMDILMFFEALLISFFALHLIKIFSLELGEIEPVVGNTVFEEGKEVHFKLRSKSPLPLASFPQLPFKMKGRVKSGMFKNHHEVEVKGKLPVGYYRFDVLKFEIASFPFFFSSFFKATSKPIEITVLPKIKIKNVLYAKNPFMIRETGDLIKKVSGSSLEFAGIKKFSPGDPLSRVWWKGLAKGGKMLKKDFFSLAEDRWILVIDLSDPDTSDEGTLLKFARGFIEMFTRKDVEIGIHIISPNYSFIDYSTNKRALLSFLIRHASDFRNLSHGGAKAVLKDAVGRDHIDIEARCKKSGISLSSFLLYAGLLKKPKKVFEWRRGATFSNATREMMGNITKSGKMLVVTEGMTDKMIDEIQKVARVKKSSLLFASFDKIPNAKTYIIPKENPEQAVWRLMYA